MPHGYLLGHGTVIRFLGSDRCRVFNNLCTQDLRKLSSGQALESFVTDVKGRTFGHGIAVAWGDGAMLLTVPGQAEKLVPHFDRYIIREDAQVSDISQEFVFCLFENPSACCIALGISNEQVPGKQCCNAIQMDDRELLLVHAPWIGPESLLCLVPGDVADKQTHVFRERLGDGWVVSDMLERSAWERYRIQAFWPWYGIDMDDRNLPQEIDRNDAAISFNKGCYLGQETIARLDMLGQVQKKLVALEIDSTQSVPAQSVVSAVGKDVGVICSVAMDTATGKCISLAYVKRSHFKSGQILSVAGAPAVVTE